MPSIACTLNTTQQVPQAVQDQVWTELMKAGAENCTEFRIGYPVNSTLAQTLKAFGRPSTGRSSTKAIEGKLSPALLDWLISNNAREKLDWMEFYNGTERCLEHFDEGQQVTVMLDTEAALKLKQALQAQGINPDVTLFISAPDVND